MKMRVEFLSESSDDEARIDAVIHADELVIAVKSLMNKLELLCKTGQAREMSWGNYIEEVRQVFETTLRNLEVWHLVR